MRKRRVRNVTPPRPRTPDVTEQMVAEHAHQLFRDVYPEKPLTLKEWRLVEEDLVRKLERKGL